MLKKDYKYKNVYYSEKKFDSGFFGYFEIGTMDECPENWYSVVLSIGKKKKKVKDYFDEGKFSNTYTENVGSGLEPLLWAKQCLIEFEKEIAPLMREKEIFILVYGEDSRRRKIYKWALSKIGYSETKSFGKICMVKKIIN